MIVFRSFLFPMNALIEYARKSVKPRTSEERSEEKGMLSLESQHKALSELAQDRKYKVVEHFQENMSAYKPGRPIFNQMLQLLRQGKADGILVWHLNRIARNPVDAGQIIFLFDEGVLKSIVTPQRTYLNTAEDKFILQIELAFSKKSSDDSSKTIQENMKTAAAKGQYPARVPMGYLNIDETGRISGKRFDSKKQVMLEELGRPLKRIEIDPVCGPLMVQLFAEAATGRHGLTDLLVLANRLGLRAPRRGGALTKSSLGNILRNPFYTGCFWYRGELHSDLIQHEPLISKDVFTAVQKALKDRGFSKKEIHTYQFTGTMTCGECGSAISGQIQKGHKYYHCSRWKARFGAPCDQRKYYREEWLEEQVAVYLEELTLPSAVLNCALEAFELREGDALAQAKLQKEALQKNLKKEQQKLHNLFQLKISPGNEDGSLLDEDDYRDQRKLIKKEVADLEKAILDLEMNDASWMENCREFFDFASQLKQVFLDGDHTTKKAIIHGLGKAHLNHGKVQFELKEPYSYLPKLAYAMTPQKISSEPKNSQLKTGNSPVLYPDRTVWWTLLYEIRTHFRHHLFINPAQSLSVISTT